MDAIIESIVSSRAYTIENLSLDYAHSDPDLRRLWETVVLRLTRISKIRFISEANSSLIQSLAYYAHVLPAYNSQRKLTSMARLRPPSLRLPGALPLLSSTMSSCTLSYVDIK